MPALEKGSQFKSNINTTPASSRVSSSTSSTKLVNKDIKTKNQKFNYDRTKYILGLFSLGLVVILWVSSSFLMSLLLRIYPKPFFSTYVSTATFQLYFPILFISSIFKKPKYPPKITFEEDRVPRNTNNLYDIDEHHPSPNSSNASLTIKSPSSQPTEKLTKREILYHSFVFFTIYFISCYLANLSFEYTDVVSASILLSTSCFFTLIFSIIAGFERFTLMKGLSVLICAGGLSIVCLLSYIYDESGQQSNPPVNMALGNAYAITSALLYGLYSVILKKKTIDESRINMPFFFGCVGLLSTVLLWPFFLILHKTKLEVLEMPSTYSLALLIVNNLFGSLAANFCWVYALLYTSPLIVSIGLAFSIPLTILLDFAIYGNSVLHFRSLAGIFIVLGFVILNLTTTYPAFDSFFEKRSPFAVSEDHK